MRWELFRREPRRDFVSIDLDVYVYLIAYGGAPDASAALGHPVVVGDTLTSGRSCPVVPGSSHRMSSLSFSVHQVSSVHRHRRVSRRRGIGDGTADLYMADLLADRVLAGHVERGRRRRGRG